MIFCLELIALPHQGTITIYMSP